MEVKTLSKEQWNPTNPKYQWSTEKELEEMIYRGRFRAYDRLYDGCVENISLHSDGSNDGENQ